MDIKLLLLDNYFENSFVVALTSYIVTLSRISARVRLKKNVCLPNISQDSFFIYQITRFR